MAFQKYTYAWTTRYGRCSDRGWSAIDAVERGEKLIKQEGWRDQAAAMLADKLGLAEKEAKKTISLLVKEGYIRGNEWHHFQRGGYTHRISFVDVEFLTYDVCEIQDIIRRVKKLCCFCQKTTTENWQMVSAYKMDYVCENCKKEGEDL